MASELEFDSEVAAIAEALGEAISTLPEYEAFKAAEAAVETSPEAQAKIDEFESKRESLMVAQQLGEATEEDVAELRELQAKLHALPVMEEYLTAQQALDERLAAINDTISRDLAVDFAGQAGSCCHD